MFTDNFLIYDNKSYLDEVLKEIYQGSGRYYFSNGDYLSVNIKSNYKGKSQLALKNTISNNTSYINYSYGGYVRESNLSE